VFAETFKNYEHGLNLIRETSGRNKFTITPDVVKNPAATLDDWIRSFYIKKPR
jgi:hypothetical protein